MNGTQAKSINYTKYDCRELETFLRKNFGNELILVSYTIDQLVPLGENFGSNMLKLGASVRRTKDSPIEDLNFVAKTIIDSEIKHNNWTDLILRETFMYTHIIPFYQKIEIECGINENTTIRNNIALLYGYRMSLDSNTDIADRDAVILLEDLYVRGYYVLDKIVGLDLLHATNAIKLLARFHAIGIIAKNKYPSEFGEIKTRSLKQGFSHSVLNELYQNLVNVIKKVPIFQEYIPFMENIVTRVKGGWKFELVTHDLWSTVIHNDFWTNNIMFHRDKSGNVDDVKFIDFQTYSFADLFVDLTYFLCTSLNDDVKFNHFDELLDVYYETFINNLKIMNFNVDDYSRKKFDDRFREDAWKEFLHCALALHFFTADIDRNVENPDKMFSKLRACEGTDLYHKKVMQVLRIFQLKNWLDCDNIKKEDTQMNT